MSNITVKSVIYDKTKETIEMIDHHIYCHITQP